MYVRNFMCDSEQILRLTLLLQYAMKHNQIWGICSFYHDKSNGTYRRIEYNMWWLIRPIPCHISEHLVYVCHAWHCIRQCAKLKPSPVIILSNHKVLDEKYQIWSNFWHVLQSIALAGIYMSKLNKTFRLLISTPFGFPKYLQILLL